MRVGERLPGGGALKTGGQNENTKAVGIAPPKLGAVYQV
jgi:hypothetical protein